jgi:hypothetical protein
MTDKGSRIEGFLVSCWTFRDTIVWSWDFAAAVIVGVLAWTLPTDLQVVAFVEPLAAAGVALGAALVGVVVAGLAVVVALLDDALLALMETDVKSGYVAGHIFPYWFVTATGVVTLLLGTLLSVAGEALYPELLRPLFAAEAAFLVWTVLGVFNLVGSLQALGLNRALVARLRTPTAKT